MTPLHPRVALLLAPLFALVACGACQCGPTDLRPPKGQVRQATYLTMRDGTRIAVDAWLPSASAKKLPTLLRLTRYWRTTDYTDPALELDDPSQALGNLYNQLGYAYVAVDARGTGASFGASTSPWNRDEVADMRVVLDWVASQPWSDARVVPIGASYDGNSAVWAALGGHPAVKTVVPQFWDLDPFTAIVAPGGVRNRGFVGDWAEMTRAKDRVDLCALASVEGLSCEQLTGRERGPLPVDAALLPSAVAEHASNLDLAASLTGSTRDFAFTDAGTTFDDLALYPHLAEISAAGVPWYTQVSWLDAATADGALFAFQQTTHPMVLVIGATSHGGVYDADPFAAVGAAPDPTVENQYRDLFNVLESHLKWGAPVKRELRYFTLNERTWRTTSQWPPAGVKPRSYTLGSGRALTTTPTDPGTSSWSVSVRSTTGLTNRWRTPLTGADIVYGDRASEDVTLATWTSAPLQASLRVTGAPVLRVRLSSSAPAGALFAYLEDVAPDGRVTLVTEGQLALSHRALAARPPWGAFPQSHRQADLRPVVPGEAMELELHLLSTSVLFRKGHALRLALGGADADTFEPLTPEGTTFTVETGPNATLELPILPG